MSAAIASDEIDTDGVRTEYKGGIQAFCRDYAVLIELESKRTKGELKGLINNDQISSTMRVMGLVERVGNERVGVLVQKCIFN